MLNDLFHFSFVKISQIAFLKEHSCMLYVAMSVLMTKKLTKLQIGDDIAKA